ncbi:uncharacterized protein si:ch211-102c2.4 isoform X3 [Myxocyprinus asiaticus]|uniref:uncharacterized protein si:ch211-102c2.4 isoform X3 n=1 Tax=Myxocyprinus asiaticus TaxID=70543 RepID=UPI0022223612|nr:uncharacterized protein si:ch211-102c2.4 isoform X3 [Myxocyprinus asiaticus]
MRTTHYINHEEHIRAVNPLHSQKHCLSSMYHTAIMNLITAFFLLFLTGHSTCQNLQELYCPYESKNTYQTRVWCKKDTENGTCCTGFSFRPNVSILENGNVYVKDDGKAFTVLVLTLTQGDGVYWCGLRAEDNTIIKLAEDYFYITPPNFVWSILRWIFFLLLPLMSISIYIYSNRKYGDTKKTNENIMLSDAM